MGKNKISTALVNRLRSEGFIAQDSLVTFRRCYHGYHQRSAGAWSWMIEGAGVDIGSCYPAKQVLRASDFAGVFMVLLRSRIK